MAEPAINPHRTRARLIYLFTIVIVAIVTAAVMYLGQNIMERKVEARQESFQIVSLTEETIDPSEWGKNFPRQYDSYRRTVDVERTRHGGSDAFQKLDADPRWRLLFDGYAFGVDYREERGHAYMLQDQDITERVKSFKQPGACLQCHASILPAYKFAGRKAGVPDSDPQAQIMKGFEIVCAMPYKDARHLKNDNGTELIAHPVSCIDCHDSATLQLRVTRPGFLIGIQELAKNDAPLPHLPSIERWRKTNREKAFDINKEASRQEMRSLVCAQCHVEYYFKGEGKLLTYPWHKGLKVENIEEYYNEVKHVDWTHKTSGAPLLKAQHPEFEMWSQGIHSRSGVSCADCHMPYKREGAIKISDHHVRSPLLNISRACQTCHHYPEAEILSRANAIQDRTKGLMIRAEEANCDLIRDLDTATKTGASPEVLKRVRDRHRQAQWRLDFVAAENSIGFHAPQEAARILAEAIDIARKGQVELLKKEK